MADRRKINDIWTHHPRPAEYYLFGRRGSGTTAVVVTLGFARTREGIDRLARVKMKQYGLV